MPSVRLRLSSPNSFAVQVIENDSFAEGEIERLLSLSDRLQSVGELTVTVEVEQVLGVSIKPLPVGRHRATVEVLEGATWTPLVTGTLTNERAAHGRAYGTLRRWTLTLLDDAADIAWERLEGVQLRDAAEVAQWATGRLDTEWRRATGDGLEAVTLACWSVAGLTALAAQAAALPAITAPEPFAGTASTVSLCAPRSESQVTTYRTVPMWTGGQLVELRCEAEQLILEASYAAFPSPDIGSVELRSVAAPVPQPGTLAFGVLISLDDDGTGQPWHEDYDWSTEPGDSDGVVLDDIALTYRSGPDGSFIEHGDVLEVPLEATYAARKQALTGQRAPGRDGGRTVANGQTLELPVLLAAAESSTAPGTAYATITVGSTTVETSRPVYDIGNPSDGQLQEPDEGAVYLVSLTTGSTPRAVVVRRDASGRSTHELWARELYPRLSYAAGDAEVVELTVPADAVPEGAVTLGSASAGVVFEGLAWIVRSVSRAVDGRTVTLSIARPAGAISVVEGGGGGGTRQESPPDLDVVVDSYAPEGDTYTDVVTATASMPEGSDVPSSITVQVMRGSWVTVHATGTTGSASYQQVAFGRPPAQADPFTGEAWRARAHYPSGTMTAWTTATAS